jgi:D-sedoheptulose 7-phosphate isomerase
VKPVIVSDLCELHEGESAAIPSDLGELAPTVVKQYLTDLSSAIDRIDQTALAELAALLYEAIVAGRRVFIAGNGGSAAAASHMASDWSVPTPIPLSAVPVGDSRRQLPMIIALNDNIARLTAIANDHCYEEVFSRQIEGRGRPGDVLLILSVSGGSPNLVRAARLARRQGMSVLSVLGHRGSVAAESDHVVVLGAGDYGVTEDLHLAVNHMVVRLLDGGAARVYSAPFPAVQEV